MKKGTERLGETLVMIQSSSNSAPSNLHDTCGPVKESLFPADLEDSLIKQLVLDA